MNIFNTELSFNKKMIKYGWGIKYDSFLNMQRYSYSNIKSSHQRCSVKKDLGLQLY